jgi:thiamine biosynthesis lipoprotein
VKTVYLGHNEGIATSGTYNRGQHIFNPTDPTQKTITDIVSLSVIGPNVLEADRFATAAFAMGERGIYLIQQRPGLEGYVINRNNIATQTTGFETYTKKI